MSFNCSEMNFLIVILFFAWFSPILNPVCTLTHSPPLITKQPSNGESLFQISSNPNENEKPFIIECEAEGEPAPTYLWMKNGKNFTYETYDDRISQQPGRGTLVIKLPREEDIGQYQCFAVNEFGVATSNSVFLRKAELNSFKDELPVKKEAPEGLPFKLGCQPPDGWPKPIVYWLIQGLDGTIKTINNSRMTVDPEGNLWFSNVTIADQSEDSTYACSASSVFRNEYKLGNKVILKVRGGTSSPIQNKVPPTAQYLTRRNEVAHRDTTATLYCIYGGTPLPETLWFKGGISLKTSDRVSRGNYGKSLVIKHVTSEDEGDYTCEVSNGVGEVKSHTISLKVLAAPYFIEEPEVVNGAENETAEFRCKASGNPEPQILWIYNGKPISEAPYNPRRTVKTNSIVIEKLQKSDTGNYGCNATNSIGYVYKDVYVNVLALAPDIIEKPRDEKTVEGRSSTITCRVVGSPKPAVKWVRNGIELTGGRYSTLPSGDLLISEVSFSDSGNYTCFAQNKIGNDSATGSLTVKQKTTISEGPIDYEVQAGSPATFRCSAQQDPDLVLTVDWLRNGEYINFESEPRFVQMPDSSLTITKTTELDSGEYTCMASTSLDNATAKATLIVQDIPNPPKLISVSCYEHKARLEWTPMGDNRAPIINYIIQYNTSFTPDSWNDALSSVPASDIASTVPMTPWANYTFRVIARNKIGLSPPSQHSSYCKTDEDVPYKNPSNVMAQGTEPTNLVISWTPMPQIEHHGPQFYYEVFWRLVAPGSVWTSQKISRWESSEFVVLNVPTFVQYEVKVTANNARGQANVPAESVIGYSGEDSPTEAPRNLTVVEIFTARSANISWYGVPVSSVRGHLKGYKIQMWPDYDSAKSRMKEIISPGNATHIVIDKLVPNARNLVRVLVFNGKYHGPPSEEVTINTPEGVPDAVQSVKLIPLGSSAFLVSWKQPLETNGALTGYLIHYEMLNNPTMPQLIPRKPQITDPNQTQVKLAGLKSGTRYRVHVNATTKAGAGEGNFAEEYTRGTSNSPPFKPEFDYSIVDTSMFVKLKIRWFPCGWDGNCGEKTAGTHFYVKYKIKGEPTYLMHTEIDQDFAIISGLEPGQTYEFTVGSVDGDFATESDSQEVDTSVSADNPIMQKKENLATAGWFVAMVLAIAFLIIVLILICLVKRNRGGKYVVHEREAANGRHDYPEEPGFHEYSQPLGGAPRNRDSMMEKKPSPESDTDSMAEFAEGDTDGMNEDGSFIGQYGKHKRNVETGSAAFATLV